MCLVRHPQASLDRLWRRIPQNCRSDSDLQNGVPPCHRSTAPPRPHAPRLPPPRSPGTAPDHVLLGREHGDPSARRSGKAWLDGRALLSNASHRRFACIVRGGPSTLMSVNDQWLARKPSNIMAPVLEPAGRSHPVPQQQARPGMRPPSISGASVMSDARSVMSGSSGQSGPRRVRAPVG